MTTESDLDQLVCSCRYPIADLDSSAGAALVQRCRSELDRLALSALPGFISEGAISQMTDEALRLAPRSHRRDRLRTPYSWSDNRGFAADHPRAALTPMRQGTITTDLLGPESILRRLYAHRELTEFVRRALGLERLHPSADPYLGVLVNVLEQDDTIGWHFDANDVVVGILLAQADRGGDYEYAPYVRDDGGENYPAIRRILDGSSDLVVRPVLTPGTLYFFKGHRSAHRVTAIGTTARPRLSAILSYHQEPGQIFSEATLADVFDPSPEPFLGTESGSR